MLNAKNEVVDFFEWTNLPFWAPALVIYEHEIRGVQQKILNTSSICCKCVHPPIQSFLVPSIKMKNRVSFWNSGLWLKSFGHRVVIMRSLLYYKMKGGAERDCNNLIYFSERKNVLLYNNVQLVSRIKDSYISFIL